MTGNKQVAALPWRQSEVGLEILLITTRSTKRWVAPKGWPMVGKADHEAAAIEAYEEAGVRGDIDPSPIGSYGYVKVLRNGQAKHVNVQVYAMRVDETLEDWPEREERQRRWVDHAQALAIIGEPELTLVVAAFEGQSAGASSKPQLRFGFFEIFKKWCSRILRHQE
jgi:8-oxo-dGTP pyrophosphatase MutT (NUDIX family)